MPSIMYALLTAILVLAVVFLVRNQLTLQYRSRRIDEILERNLRLIKKGESPGFEAYDAMGTYDSQLFDLRLWSYRQFFPESFEEDE